MLLLLGNRHFLPSVQDFLSKQTGDRNCLYSNLSLNSLVIFFALPWDFSSNLLRQCPRDRAMLITFYDRVGLYAPPIRAIDLFCHEDNSDFLPASIFFWNTRLLDISLSCLVRLIDNFVMPRPLCYGFGLFTTFVSALTGRWLGCRNLWNFAITVPALSNKHASSEAIFCANGETTRPQRFKMARLLWFEMCSWSLFFSFDNCRNVLSFHLSGPLSLSVFPYHVRLPTLTAIPFHASEILPSTITLDLCLLTCTKFSSA